MIAEMELMKSEFSRRYDAMMNDYEELGTVVRQLNKQLKKRDEELSILRIRYEDAMAENDLLYEAFNNELDQMYDLFEQKSSSRGRRTATSMDHPHEQQGGDTNNQRRPAHPSPEAQIRKKLELTIKERNQWHQTACKLARELQSLSQMSGSSSSLNTTPSSSSTNISMMAATSTTTSHNIRPANSRSTPIPPFRHSSQ
ncbi:hypothetical protein BDA99DRAFT_5902 [Phascolomyces articulosus]|uniref:Uncharacterized protein n=1 Tax=Phascolomyces articulosus TaxID=60185 RepID=A0AAD5KBT9_9FUNG|nr:hypothetical protein BDA99DRAFT_5902 [Phascolomyces articulosus]